MRERVGLTGPVLGLNIPSINDLKWFFFTAAVVIDVIHYITSSDVNIPEAHSKCELLTLAQCHICHYSCRCTPPPTF